MISVVIPFYNIEAYLRECLDSVSAQTETDWECLLINDGSTDGSRLIAAEKTIEDNRFRLIDRPNGGLSSARNSGIDRARGQWLTFIDGDDTVHPQFLSILSEVAASHPADIIMTGFTRQPDFPHNAASAQKTETYTSDKAIEHALYRRRKFNTSAWGKLYRRELFDDGLRFTPGILYEDLEIFPRLWERAARITVISNPLYHYRIRSGSIMDTFTHDRLNVLKIVDAIERRYAGNPRLLAAARNRKFSATFNMLLLLRRHGFGAGEEASACLRTIKRLRLGVILNRKSRTLNRLGAIASFGGLSFLDALNRRLHIV